MPIKVAWDKDLLNRKEEGDFLSSYLIKRYENNSDTAFVLNVNAEWGFGKSYFLTNLSEDLKVKKHPVVYFDAWKNDFTKQPLLAFIAELDTALKPYFSTSTKGQNLLLDTIKKSTKLFLPLLSKKLTGFALDELNDLLNDDTATNPNKAIDLSIEDSISTIISQTSTFLLNEHKSHQDSILQFKTSLNKLLKYIDRLQSKNLPLFVFIDELDRCRPNYAIELLENIKHIFDIPGVVFVIATDSKQLSHSINAIYGNNFESERYLKRFFDQEYVLTEPNTYSFANYLFEQHHLSENTQIFSPLEKEIYPETNLNALLFSLYASYFQLSLRDQEQVMTVISAICITWIHNESIHLGYLLFLIMLKQKSTSSFISYLSDENNWIEKINRNNTITFKHRQTAKEHYNSSTIKEQSIGNLIDRYIHMAKLNLEQLWSYNSSGNLVYTNIKNTLTKELPSSYRTDQIPTTKLHIYSTIIQKAGQLS